MSKVQKKAKKPAARRGPHSVHAAWRTVAAVVGLGALGAGGYAVFVTKLEAGPVALLTVGFLFLMVGMSGKLPNRIKFGDNEASWQEEREAAQKFIEQVIDQPNDEQRMQAVSALEELNEAAPHVAAPALSALLYEDVIMTMLRQLHAQSLSSDGDLPPFDLIQPQNSQARQLVDALLVSPSQVAIAVEIKGVVRPIQSGIVNQVVGQFARLRQIEPRAKLALLVCRSDLTAASKEILRANQDIRTVKVPGSQDLGQLAQAIREAFADAQSH